MRIDPVDHEELKMDNEGNSTSDALSFSILRSPFSIEWKEASWK